MVAEAAGWSLERARMWILDMLADGEFRGPLGWDEDPGWSPPSPSEHWRERREGKALLWDPATGKVFDDFPKPANLYKAMTEDDEEEEEPREPGWRTPLLHRATCEAIGARLRLARKKPAPQQSKPAPEAPRKVKRHSKIDDRIGATYPGGISPTTAPIRRSAERSRTRPARE